MSVRLELQDEIRLKTKIEDQCWIWQRRISVSGYGDFQTHDRKQRIKDFFPNNTRGIAAHKVSHIVFRGDIPKDKVVLHTCNKKHCCNPDHLYLGTRLDVAANGIKNGHRANTAKYRNKSDDVKNDIRGRILGGQSFSSIGRRYGMHATTIRCYAVALEKQTKHTVPQRAIQKSFL